jgi:competence protein ComEA
MGSGGAVVYESSDGGARATEEASQPAGARGEGPTTVWVHVVGAVHAPGVYELEPGARVGDAVALAGGALGNAAPEGVNLAREVADGEQVHVPTADEWAAGGGQTTAESVAPRSGAPGAGGAASGAVDINSADATVLETLPGVGPATAQKIIADREENGPFTAVEDLMRVAGIGEKKLDAIRDLVVVR